MRIVRYIALAVALLLFLSPRDLGAQTGSIPRDAEFSAAFVEAGHWSIAEVRRLAAAGLAPAGFDAGRRVYTQREIALVFEHAQHEADEAETTAARAMVGSFMERFAEEFAGEPSPGNFRGSTVAGSFARHTGDDATVWGYWYGNPEFGVGLTAPEPRPEVSGVGAHGALQWTPIPSVAARLSAGDPPGEDGPRLGESHISGEWGAIRLWAGRHAIGYGPGVSGGVVLSDGALFDGFGIQSRRPFRLPWVLQHLGWATFDVTLSQFDMERSFDDVYFLATRGSLSPHDRVQVGVSRAAMFGGDGNSEVDAFAIFSILIGKHAGEVSELDNQVVSVDVSYRPPTERWLPLRAYVEWGFEDSAGAWRDVPGLLAGIQVPFVPGLPETGFGFEYTHFANACCGNPFWYRHNTFQPGWTRGGDPLGHPLGGHGRQWGVYGSASLWQARVRATTQLFQREYMSESLYAADRLGKSVGFDLGVEWRASSWLEVSAVQRLEDGAEDWSESFFRLGVRALL